MKPLLMNKHQNHHWLLRLSWSTLAIAAVGSAVIGMQSCDPPKHAEPTKTVAPVWFQLSVGMSQDEVTAVLGKPYATTAENKRVWWYFKDSTGQEGSVEFDKESKKVVGWKSPD